MKANLYRDREILCRDNKSYVMIEFYCDIIKLGRDRNRRRTKISQVRHVATKISMSRQIALRATRIKEENFVMTEIAKDSKKSCHDRENSVATELIG